MDRYGKTPDSTEQDGEPMDVDASQSTAEGVPINEQPMRRGHLVREEERKGIIEFRNVVNDNSREAMILLTGTIA